MKNFKHIYPVINYQLVRFCPDLGTGPDLTDSNVCLDGTLIESPQHVGLETCNNYNCVAEMMLI